MEGPVGFHDGHFMTTPISSIIINIKTTSFCSIEHYRRIKNARPLESTRDFFMRRFMCNQCGYSKCFFNPPCIHALPLPLFRPCSLDFV